MKKKLYKSVKDRKLTGVCVEDLQNILTLIQIL